MYCSSCGKQIPSDAKYCIECGTGIERKIVTPNLSTSKPDLLYRTWVTLLFTLSLLWTLASIFGGFSLILNPEQGPGFGVAGFIAGLGIGITAMHRTATALGWLRQDSN